MTARAATVLLAAGSGTRVGAARVGVVGLAMEEADGDLWLCSADGQLLRIDGPTRRVASRTELVEEAVQATLSEQVVEVERVPVGRFVERAEAPRTDLPRAERRAVAYEGQAAARNAADRVTEQNQDRADAERADEVEQLELELLLEAVYRRYGYDFRHYAPASLRRRLRRRQDAEGVATLSQLQDRLLHEPASMERLLLDLSISVTAMFRDPSFYVAFRNTVVPALRTYPFTRLWCAGCPTGEEVYSLAILLREEGLEDRTMIYGTDINPEALRRAEAGVYEMDRIPLFTENHRRSGGKSSLSDYYTAAYGGALFDHALVENVTFADHSLATDAVFAETHFISCRNVMIYFNRRLQNRVLGLFHESLCHRGFLGLGSKESIDFSSYAQRFESLARRERLFRKVGA